VQRQRWIVLFLPLILAATLLPASGAGAAPGDAPRLRLRAPSSTIDVFRSPRQDSVRLELPIYLESHDAPFDLRVRRATYDDPAGVWQAIHGDSGVDLHALPADILDGWNGLADFMRVRIYRSDGTLLRRATSTICPAGWDSQRIDDTGPFDPTYPSGCWAWTFTLGTVWGVDEGWAVQPTWVRPPRVRLRDGTYDADVSITRRYRELFGIAEADGSVDVQLRIGPWRDCSFCGAPRSPRGERTQDALTSAPIVLDPDPSTIADLVALPAFDIGIDRHRDRDYLRFGANVWSRGPASLVVEGFRAEGEDRMDAYQYFYADDEIVGRAPVGSFEFDRRDGHHHWHFLQFARYRLLDESLERVVRSRKQSFCLAPTDAIDLTVDGAVWSGDWGSRCGWEGSLWIRETLPTGWGDTYYQGVPGQSFDITDVSNGTYWVEVRANPQELLFDADPSNDTELREVILGGKPGARTVRVLPWHGIEA
jgi:hypothetical protein